MRPARHQQRLCSGESPSLPVSRTSTSTTPLQLYRLKNRTRTTQSPDPYEAWTCRAARQSKPILIDYKYEYEYMHRACTVCRFANRDFNNSSFSAKIESLNTFMRWHA
eukprot:scaffold6534_cov20-Prasinocladus_malaysianus.AAC.1